MMESKSFFVSVFCGSFNDAFSLKKSKTLADLCFLVQGSSVHIKDNAILGATTASGAGLKGNKISGG